MITSSKRNVSVVTLSLNDDIKFLERVKQLFERRIAWDKYRSEITAQPRSNNLGYMIDSTFQFINRLFAQSFKVDENDPTINYFMSITYQY